MLLQRRFIVSRPQAVVADFDEVGGELALDERLRLLNPAVDINRGDQRFVAVRQQRRLLPPAGLLLAPAEQQVIAEPQSVGLTRESAGGDQ